jgi:hypothetical protein
MMERESYKSPLIIGFVFASLLVFSPQIVFAQTTSAPLILPDNAFWGLKLFIENLQENITFNEPLRAEIILKHIEERDREALELERRGLMIPLDRLEMIRQEKIAKAEFIIQKLERALQQQETLEQMFADRSELAQATQSDRVQILRDQQLQSPIVGGVPIDRPIGFVPVQDINDSDTDRDILTKLKTRLENSFDGSQITEIRAKFTELRLEEDFERKQFLADQLDEEVNNPLVSITCFGRVDTLSLSLATDPIVELQEQCPVLRAFDTELVRDIANGN